MPTYQELGFGRGAALSGDRARTAFGQVMGLTTITLGFAALGAYLMHKSSGGAGFGFIILEFACIFGLNAATRRGHEQLATGLLFALGLFAGMFIAPFVDYYAKANPGVVYQAAAATALFTAVLGIGGYTSRRDLSGYWKPLMIAFGVVFVFGLIALFVAIPGSNVIYCALMLLVFGGFTVFDFNRLARGNYMGPVPMAASLFLDIFNVFILLLSLFGGGGGRGRR